MPAIIILLEHVLSIIALLFIALIITLFINESRSLSKLRRKYRLGQSVYFYAGQKRLQGKILKKQRNRVQIRSYMDKKIYYSNYYSIESI